MDLINIAMSAFFAGVACSEQDYLWMGMFTIILVLTIGAAR